MPPGLSDQPDVDGLRPLAALDHVDRYSLALRQIGEAATVERRGMRENVLAAAVPDDEPESLIPVVPFYRTDLLDGGLIGGLVRPFGPWAARLLLQPTTPILRWRARSDWSSGASCELI